MPRGPPPAREGESLSFGRCDEATVLDQIPSQKDPTRAGLVGWVVYHQTLDLGALLGVALIIAGVVVRNVFPKALPHG